MFRPYDPTETAVGLDLKTMHTDANDPIGPAPACRVGSGRLVCGQLNDCWNPYNCLEVSLLLLQGVTLWLLFITIYAGYHYTVIKRTFNNNYIITICDVMAQNQSHVAKHKRAEICILSENVKLYPFFIFIKNKIFM